MKIQCFDSPQEDAVKKLYTLVRQYNTEVMGYNDARPLNVLAWNDSEELAGGVGGRTIYGHFLVEVVWVAADSRRSGLGRQLMETAEQEARARGCTAAQVDTLSFQGREFYARLGFTVVGQIDNFPPGHQRYFMHKLYT